MSRCGRPTTETVFSAQCDNCERFYFKSDVREAVIRNRKTGESDTFLLCQKCRENLRSRIMEDAGEVYGIDGKTYAVMEKLYKSTVKCAQKSGGRKAHCISINDLIKLWLIQDGVCAMTGRKFDLDGDANLFPSVDRINSQASYTTDNIHFVCQMVNYMKGDYPIDAFIEACGDIWLRRVGKMAA